MDTKLLKQKILDLAIRGKLVPQNPADEPASVLLERIKAEKSQLIKEGKIKKEKPLPPIEEVPFEIPESWEWCRLGSICSKFSTGPFGSMVHKTDYVLENGIPMLNPANIVNGSISRNKLMLVSIQKSNDLLNFRLNIDDVILARRGDLSKCAIINSQHEGWLCGTGSFFMHLLELIPRFFQIIYATSDIQSFLSSESVGATMDNLNQGLLAKMLIPIPPLIEQKRIVAEIDRWFKCIDELEKNQQDLHTAIQQAKSKILDLAIHGKLVPQESEWEEKTIEEINEYKSKGVNPLNNPDELYELYSVPTFDSGKPEFLTGQEIGSSKQAVLPRDILLCKINPHLNRVWFVTHFKEGLRCIASSEWIIIRSSVIYYKYLVFYFQSPSFRDLLRSNVSGVGGSLMRAQPAFVKSYPVYYPSSVDEQKRIVDKIEQIFTQLDNIEKALA